MDKKRLFGRMIGLLCGCGLLLPTAAEARICEQALEPAGSGWTITEARYTGEVVGDVARVTAELTVKVFRDGWPEIPLGFENATLTDLKVSGGSAAVVIRNDRYAISVQKRGNVRVTAALATHLNRDSQYEGITIGIPQAVFSNVTLTIPRAEVELASEHALTVTKGTQGNKTVLTASLGLDRQVALRWMVRPIKPLAVEPVYTADVRVLGTLEEETLRTLAFMGIHLVQGELKTIVFDLPVGLTVVGERGLPIDDWKAVSSDGWQRVTVNLSEPLRVGGHQMIVEAEQPIADSSGKVTLPSLVPVGSKRLTGYLAMATGTSMELRDPVLDGLTRIDVRELPSDLRGVATAPVVAAFRYQQAPYRIEATLYRPEELAVLVAIAESAEMATVVTPTGEMITRAIYRIRNNKKGSLGVALPTGATLWSVLVDHRAVKPAAGPNGQVLIPLAAAQGPEFTFPVEIVYVEKAAPFKWIGKATYQGPVLDIPVTVSSWYLFLPEKVRGYGFGGNLQRDLKIAGFLPEQTLPAEPQSVEGFAYNSSAATKWGEVGRGLGFGSARTRKAQLASGSVSESMELNGNEPKAAPAEDRRADLLAGLQAEMVRNQQAGLLPFRIAVPQSGRMYRFGRLLTGADPLRIQVQYVKLPNVPWAVGCIGLLGLAGMGGIRKRLFRRR